MTVRILSGDCREVMRTLPAQSVHMVATSPPYWKLRSYLDDGDPLKEYEIGGEPTPDLYVAHIVEVMREVWRVLRDDGTVWMVIGDSYYNSRPGTGGDGSSSGLMKDGRDEASRIRTAKLSRKAQNFATMENWAGPLDMGGQASQVHGSAGSQNVLEGFSARLGDVGLKPKDLLMIPARVVLALQADGCADFKAVQTIARVRREMLDAYDGEPIPDRVISVLERLDNEYREAKGDSWWVRSAIVWAKGVSFCKTYSGSCMPESVRDRPTTSYEMVFLLSKSARYFYDGEAVKERGGDGSDRWGGATMDLHTQKAFGGDAVIGQQANRPLRTFEYNGKRNLRSVWTIPDTLTEFLKFCETQGMGALWDAYRDGQREVKDTWVIGTSGSGRKHYAAYPEALVRPMILAGTSERGCCPNCGSPYERVTERREGGNQNWAQDVNPSDKETSLIESGNRCGHGKLNRGSKADYYANAARNVTLGWKPSCTCDAGDVICATCNTVLEYYNSHKESSTNELTNDTMSTVREGTSDLQERQEVLQSGVLPQEYTPIARQAMLGVRENIQTKGTQHSNVRQAVRLPLDGQTSEHNQGILPNSEGVHSSLSTRASKINKSGIHNGTPLCDGRGVESPPVTHGDSTPQERDQGRQQTREPGSSTQEKTLQQAETNIHSNLPSLRKRLSGERECPYCGSSTLDIVYHVKPATVLDIFVGSGTTCHVAESLGRDSIGIDLSGDYVEMARRRVNRVEEFETMHNGEAVTVEQVPMWEIAE